MEYLKRLLIKITLNDNDFTNDNYKLGGVRQSDLYKNLKEQSGL